MIRNWLEENYKPIASVGAIAAAAYYTGILSFVTNQTTAFYDNLNQTLSPAGSILVLVAVLGFYTINTYRTVLWLRGEEENEG